MGLHGKRAPPRSRSRRLRPEGSAPIAFARVRSELSATRKSILLPSILSKFKSSVQFDPGTIELNRSVERFSTLKPN